MQNDIIIAIIAIIAVIAVIGLRSAIRHFKGQSGCCGGSDYQPKRKKLYYVQYLKTFRVEGMHCEHCKNKVEESVDDIKGVAGKVNLKQGLLTVSYAEDVADDVIKARIERVGYHVV
ncbi:MAG: cation transporter [bacterium]|nr:cation transporter [bacterium]